ncbi:hypothetical protein [Actinomadura napierensis]|uniref:Sensor histidine kinase n=1 Tax=Actinomadura napierensis TaxID=267854 RepID=A0ABN2ZJJ6_9ACTN
MVTGAGMHMRATGGTRRRRRGRRLRQRGRHAGGPPAGLPRAYAPLRRLAVAVWLADAALAVTALLC